MTVSECSAGDELRPPAPAGGTGRYLVRWVQSAPARPVTQEQLATAGLALALHGPGRLDLKKSHHDDRSGDPWYLWSGTCRGAWAVSFRPAAGMLDFSGAACVRWRAWQSGSHCLRFLVEHASEGWLVSAQGDGATAGWHEFRLELRAAGWHRLDIGTVVMGAAVAGIHLGRLRAFGVADLDAGGGSGACSRLDWMEVPATAARSGT
mgnify:CR=1 FL=1